MKLPILYLLNDFSDASNNRIALTLISELDRNLYDFHVLCVKQLHGPLESNFLRAGANVFFFNHPMKSLILIPQLVKYIHEHDIKIVHTHNLRADIVGAIATFLFNQVVLISTKYNMSYVPGQKDWLIKNLLYWPIIFFPNHLITVSETLRQLIISRLLINPNRVSTIYTGINLENYFRPELRNEIRYQFQYCPDDVVITYIGRLVEGKDLECLLVSASLVLEQNRHLNLLVVGDGPLLPNLITRAEDLGILSNTIFTGFRSDIPDILAATDIFVYPSIREGLPQSLIEALAARKPVVSTQVAGMMEIIEPNISGLLVPQSDPIALAEAIRLLIDNPQLGEEFAKNGQNFVHQRFQLDTMVITHDNLYQNYFYRSHLQQPKIFANEESGDIQ